MVVFEKIAVIGIGAMGGGMARVLLEQPDLCQQISGYDQSTVLVDAFYQESVTAGKALSAPPTNLQEAVEEATFVLVVLQNEAQCHQVCLQGEACLLQLLPPGAVVMISSTVTATWMKQAAAFFEEKGIHFVDAPISGGPVRARAGDLTIMASGEEASLSVAQPVLQALGKAYIIAGGPGQGSQVKMVHQLLAGVHIVVAAEALCLAAKAGLDVTQLYDIVNGAAGASWMFRDRSPRMMESVAEVKSQLQIFVKDLDIVYQEAKKLQVPTPLASAALQQFISGQGLGLSQQDDSQVVKVYENVAGVKVSGKSQEGTRVGDYWRLPDGRFEQIVEVGSEPRHQVVLQNEYVRALRVSFPPGDTTLAHRHAKDSLYFFLVPGGLNVINHVQGFAACADCMDFGEVRYGAHETEKPLVHKITNTSNHTMLCIDAELLKSPPVSAAIPLLAERHELIKTRDKCRVYKLTLEPGQSVTILYPFFYLSIVVQTSTIEHGTLKWQQEPPVGGLKWNEPGVEIARRNVGSSTYVEYIAEWR
ncbi:3-hydroxyisobutyrate dehydrogenase [Fistulifera solaris]|uniref:3-hydroxyisobutyrate dehydrogenase n=1 Tax=Fistulifera solaris TaxID=1519565 RepID=A0A1Z5KSY8_FISSO|nr:3-hydroxyisobutyrate dehydrogenase [Fistulifera solaris]|eukprot:GAX29416.1 3-hydroxyisobutyrate dehydrogenase [Fistulifera solaris]